MSKGAGQGREMWMPERVTRQPAQDRVVRAQVNFGEASGVASTVVRLSRDTCRELRKHAENWARSGPDSRQMEVTLQPPGRFQGPQVRTPSGFPAAVECF